MGSYVTPDQPNSKMKKTVTPSNMREYAPIKRFLTQPVSFHVDSIVVIFSSHGGSNGILFESDGEPIIIDSFIDLLLESRQSKYIGIPIIIIIMCCRGGNDFLIFF